jgi:3-deoxy-manno-octulosonate cytidylyltransferase (CMP-KDO synthetase)
MPMKAYAFIPARYGSTRFPGKPLASIAGKPMIQHVYDRACSCPELSGVYVATDDQRIMECVREFEGRAIMTGQTHLSGTDRICEAAEKMGLGDEDVIVNIQGDQPMFDPTVIRDLVLPFMTDDTLPMATLMWRIRDEASARNPNHVKVVTDRQGFAIYFSRHPIPYLRDAGSQAPLYKHLGFYAFRMAFLIKFTRLPEGRLEAAEKLEQLRALEHGFRIKVVETPFNSLEVDVPEDVPGVEKALEGYEA